MHNMQKVGKINYQERLQKIIVKSNKLNKKPLTTCQIKI